MIETGCPKTMCAGMPRVEHREFQRCAVQIRNRPIRSDVMDNVHSETGASYGTDSKG